jgi:hypothetical protein
MDIKKDGGIREKTREGKENEKREGKGEERGRMLKEVGEEDMKER